MDENNLNENLVFDLNEIKDFIFEERSKTEKTHDNEITETYGLNDDGKQVLLNRVIHEVKGSDFSDNETIRYDIIKTFMGMLDNVELDTSLAPMSFGQRTVLNTMINYGFIKEMNNEG